MDLLDAARNINKTHEKDRLERLYTPWGESLDPENILSEYPRPQLRRSNYRILNGYWEYAFTDTDLPPAVFEGRILVPFSPESLLSGVERRLEPGGFLWYRRTLPADLLCGPEAAFAGTDATLTAPAESNGSGSCTAASSKGRLLLHFGAVDQSAKVYVNGKEVCSHEGGYLPFEADITAFLQPKDNLLTVRVQDDTDASFHSRGKQTLKRGGMFYTAQSGIWQTVWAEWVPDRYIRRLKITPDYDRQEVALTLWTAGAAPLTVSIDAPAEGGCFAQDEHAGSGCGGKDSGAGKESACSGEKCIFSTTVAPASDEQRQITLRARILALSPWSPEHPFLYRLRLSFGEDQVESYFAMRCFTVEPDEKGIPRFCLNHRPLFLHGVLDQGYWPDGLYTAPSDEALVYDISVMKRLGFNMLRKHIKIETTRFYYHCDRLGMIVWQDMVSGGSRYSMPMVCYLPTLFPGISGRLKDSNYKLFARESEAGRKEWEKECMDTVEYLYNTPSIAVWVPFNEGWGQFDADRITRKIKEKDPTRPVDQVSGWFDQKGGDFKSVHNYFRRLTVPKDSRAFVLSEYGGYACRIDSHSSVERIYGYRKFASRQELAKAFEELLTKQLQPLVEKGLCGAVYTQVSDVEEEVNGILTYDRKVCKLPLP